VSAPVGNYSLLKSAFEDFRAGILYMFVGLLIFGLAVGASLVGAILAGKGPAIGLGGGIIGLIGLIIFLLGILKLKEAGDKFQQFDPSLGKLSLAVKIYIATIILGILTIIIFVVMPPLGALIGLLLGLANLVASILFGLFLMNLGDLAAKGVPVPDRFKLAGILYLVGIIISILQLIALILVYLDAGEAIRRLEEAQKSA